MMGLSRDYWVSALANPLMHRVIDWDPDFDKAHVVGSLNKPQLIPKHSSGVPYQNTHAQTTEVHAQAMMWRSAVMVWMLNL